MAGSDTSHFCNTYCRRGDMYELKSYLIVTSDLSAAGANSPQ
jgi:hypothetical protein